MTEKNIEVAHIGQGEMVQVVEASGVTPAAIVDKAAEMAVILNRIVKQAGLSQKFGSKEYLQFEAWQTIGRFHNCTPVTEWTRAIKQDGYDGNWGWECRVNVITADGQLVGAAEGMCCRDESNWKKRNDYALRSMAQTRTASKALRSCFAWVAVLAGYEATPAEEMKDEYVKDKPKDEKPEFVPITPDQKAKIVEMFKAQGYEKKEATKLYREHLGSKPSKGKATAFLDNFYVLIPAASEVEPASSPGEVGGEVEAPPQAASPGLPDKRKMSYLNILVKMEDFTLEKYREVKDIYMAASLPWQKKWDLQVQAQEWHVVIPAMVKALKEAGDE